MGCLVELFFELFAEGLFELMAYCYFKLMQLIVPEKVISEKTKTCMKKIAAVIAGILLFALLIGLVLLSETHPQTKTVGKYMTCISLAIMALQLILGIVLKVCKRK